ncbi:MAG: hypothetical protein BWK80_62440, partial [Desulfobacteraceae bacterium IS3]
MKTHDGRGLFFFADGGIMKKLVCGILTILTFSLPAYAHFGMIIPSDSMIMQGENKTVTLKVSFSHPFEMVG